MKKKPVNHIQDLNVRVLKIFQHPLKNLSIPDSGS